jgi:hypothetical protein
MSVILKFDRFFAYSEEKSKYFYTEFGEHINIVHGPNTSGKSTFFLALLYTFGINDGNLYLKELLADKVIFRVDFSIKYDTQILTVTIIRDDDTLYLKKSGSPIKRFNGINGNASAEHIKLKHYLNELFEFSLLLESQGEYKSAPIETMFLPYYISQTVGWVYLRKSFSSLDFYKNFKEDYLDYYLGLDAAIDRVEKHKLTIQLKNKNAEIDIIRRFENKSEEIKLTKLMDEQFINTSKDYVEKYSQRHTILTERENEYVLKCNELAYLEERKSVIQKVSHNLKKQQPEIGNCPTCEQTLPVGISEMYIFFQEENDTVREMNVIKAKIRDIQSKINTLSKFISDERFAIGEEYRILNKYIESGVTYDSWLNSKATLRLADNLSKRLGDLILEKDEIESKLSKYKTDKQVERSRINQSREFETIFHNNLAYLGAKKLEEDRFTKLYQISAFPSQGVELHKTIMAYHFAFNQMIASTSGIHRFPFLLDAVFKEDLEINNKDIILKFISKHSPKDTQTIFSIAQAENQIDNAQKYNAEHFKGGATLIAIGDGKSKRSFLQDYKNQQVKYLDETMDIVSASSDN